MLKIQIKFWTILNAIIDKLFYDLPLLHNNKSLMLNSRFMQLNQSLFENTWKSIHMKQKCIISMTKCPLKNLSASSQWNENFMIALTDIRCNLHWKLDREWSTCVSMWYGAVWQVYPSLFKKMKWGTVQLTEH